MSDRPCYILCVRHSRSTDEALTWWGPNRSGYTYNLDSAGIYPEDEAYQIVGRGLDVVVPVDDVKGTRVALTGYNEYLWHRVWPHVTDKHNNRDKSLDRVMDDALDDSIDNEYNDGSPKCPSCGATVDYWYDDMGQFDCHADDGDRWYYECRCGKRIAVECSTSVEFRTVVMGEVEP